MSMPTFNFSLIVEGADLQSAEAQDALFEAGCDDATFGVVDGVQYESSLVRQARMVRR